MKSRFDHRKSLQELENDDWGEPDCDSSLVQTCHRLRRVPLAEFTAGNLRIMIGQKIGLPFLVPLALERLHDDPLIEANLYPGDLLKVVLGVPEGFWSVHTDMCHLFRQILARAKTLLESLPESDTRLREDLANGPPILQVNG